MNKSVDTLDECPVCGMNWVGEEIPPESRELFGDNTHFKDGPIGVEYMMTEEDYDGVSEWQCPGCHTRWGRWTGKILAAGELEKKYGRS